MNHFLKPLFLVGLMVVASSFSDGAKNNNVLLEPSFAPLEEGEASVMATIYDESTVTEVQDVSFFGHTSIGGIRKDTDDSMNKLELKNIRELVIVKPSYESKRFRDREFTLAKVITANGVLVENLLVPKHIVICGIDKKSQMERSWFLNKIDKVVVEKFAKSEAPEVVIEEIFKKEQKKMAEPEKQHEEIKREEIKREEITIEVACADQGKAVVNVCEAKKPGVKDAAGRLWDAVADLSNSLFVSVKSWF